MTQKQINDIAVKASTIIFSNEGNYGSVNLNDNGAVSVGKVQWHGNRALSLLKSVIGSLGSAQSINIVGSALYNEITSSNNWSSRIVTADESKLLSAILTTETGKAIQDSLAISDIETYVKKGISYGLTDTGALIYFADGVNQYGTNSSKWKTIAVKSLANGGDVTAMYNATKEVLTQYLTRREKVYKAVLSLVQNQTSQSTTSGTTSAQAADYFINTLKTAIYLWGGNGEIITKALCDSLFKTFGSSKYNRAYYDNKLAEGAGRIGADCSGAMCTLSGFDATATGYYNKCSQKGSIASIPRDTVCLVFKKNSSGNIGHIGMYTGDGYVSEMANSTVNYRRAKLDGNGWDLWGTPLWINYNVPTPSIPATTPKPIVVKPSKQIIDTVAAVQKWLNNNYKAALAEDNCYGSRTKQALIKAFQIALNHTYNAGLVEDGIYGNKTHSAVSQYLKKGLSKGAKGELTEVLQAALICKGYGYCNLDGDFGIKTQRAVRAYQTKKGLKVDGIAGIITLHIMFT